MLDSLGRHTVVGSVDSIGLFCLPLHEEGDLMLQQHVVLRGQAEAGTEDVLDAGALLEQGIDHWSPRRHQRSLQQIRQGGQHAVKGAQGVAGHRAGLEADAAEQLGEDDQIQDDGYGKQGVLAGVVYRYGVVTAQQDL